MHTLKYFFEVRRSQAHRVSPSPSEGIHRVRFSLKRSFANTTLADGSTEKLSEHTRLAFDSLHISLLWARALWPVGLRTDILGSQVGRREVDTEFRHPEPVLQLRGGRISQLVTNREIDLTAQASAV